MKGYLLGWVVGHRLKCSAVLRRDWIRGVKNFGPFGRVLSDLNAGAFFPVLVVFSDCF